MSFAFLDISLWEEANIWGVAESLGEWESRYSFSPDVLDRQALDQWAGDRDRYLSFSVDVTHPPVHDALEPIRTVLAKHDCTTVAPPEHYHITVKQVGCIREPPERESDITPSTASKLRRMAQETLSEVEPFEIDLPRLNLFDRVVFCEVAECDPLFEIHGRLCDLPDMPQWKYEREEYVPHMTLAHFRSREGIEELIADLEPYRDLEIPPIRIASVSLQEMHPAELYPARTTVAEFEC